MECQNTVSAGSERRYYGLITTASIDVGVNNFLFGFYLMLLFLWSLKEDAIHPDSLPLIMTKPILELHSRGRKGDGKEELAQLLCVIGLEVGLRLQ